MLRRRNPPYQGIVWECASLQLLPLPPFTLDCHLCILLVRFAPLLQLLCSINIVSIVLMEIINLCYMVF